MKVSFWNDIHALAMLVAFCLALFFISIFPIVLAGLGSFLYFGFLHRTFLASLSPFAGYANWVTFLRLLLVCFALFHATDLSPLVFAGLLTFSVILDGVDGYLARRFNQSSVFGQYFDMEVDGIALATVIAQYSGVALGLLLFGVKYSYLLKEMSSKALMQVEKLKSFLLINRDLFLRTLRHY